MFRPSRGATAVGCGLEIDQPRILCPTIPDGNRTLLPNPLTRRTKYQRISEDRPLLWRLDPASPAGCRGFPFAKHGEPMTGVVHGFARGADATRLALGHDVVWYLWYLNEPQAPPPAPTLFLVSRSGSISNVVSG